MHRGSCQGTAGPGRVWGLRHLPWHQHMEHPGSGAAALSAAGFLLLAAAHRELRAHGLLRESAPWPLANHLPWHTLGTAPLDTLMRAG